MCSIMGYCTPNADVTAFTQGFYKTKSRGPDNSRIVDTGMGLLGFHRLAIMGLQPQGMQPFVLHGCYGVCNGELYGFEAIREQLKDKYTFQSQSDCEILLPLYFEHGVDLFAQLDAEFACIILDTQGGHVIAARDPLGIRPLYYGYDQARAILFASEPKNLVGLVGRILPFPPGHYYLDGQFVRYADMTRVDQVVEGDLDTICTNIREKLVSGIQKRLVSDAPVGFLLSGGLDSSLVCAVAAKASPTPIRTFAIGMEADAIDVKYARQAASYIGADHTEVLMTPAQVVAVLPDVVRTLATYDITTIRASVGMYLVCKAIHEQTGIKTLLTGEISDELFGYKYTDYAPGAAAFQQEAAKRMRELYAYDVLRADRCLAAHSLEARVPFGDLDFVRYVMAIDPRRKLNTTGKGKYLLRQAFAGTGLLPDPILWREKAAFSDAVGHSMVDDLKAYAEQQYTDAEFAQKCAQYAGPRPFTKESLLYRELFERFYPGQAQMIPGYWMPNPAWPGCRVSDPSARVLANYGASGQ